jgi:hypothetical protein
MSLVAEAERQHLFGKQDLYTIGLYAIPPFDQEQIASPDAAKALRIAITYEPDWQRPAVVDWRIELVPQWHPEWMAPLRSAFSALQRGDVVLIEYSPRTGTRVHVNRSIAVLAAPHELMLAFLDHWLGQRPVSEDVKRSLLGWR